MWDNSLGVKAAHNADERRPRVDWPRLLALFILAVSVRVAYICSTPPDASVGSVDAWGYHRLALNLDSGNGFSLRRQAPFVPDSVRTPLYPGFLLLIRQSLGPEPRRAAIVQAVLDGFTTLLTWQIAARLGGQRAARVAALLYALNPSQVRYANDLLTETLLSFLLALCMYALIRYAEWGSNASAAGTVERHGGRARPHVRRVGWLALIAMSTGLAALCKPNVQYAPLIWLLSIALLCRYDWRRGLVDAGTMMLIIACILTPWIVRNHLVFGRPFLSTAFEGNVSRVSAPATLAYVRGQYVAPWSADWEGLFGEIVSQTAARYGWDQPWDTLTASELDTYNHQVYLVAREVVRRHPSAWLKSHLQGMGRYLEPQTFRACYARFTGEAWPPDILEDAVIHVFREIGRGNCAQAGQIVSTERWARLTPLQGTVWWGTFAGQVIGSLSTLLGLWRLRRQPALAAALCLTILYVLWLPGPIAYERFRVPVMSLILAAIGASVSATPSAGRPNSRNGRSPRRATHLLRR